MTFPASAASEPVAAPSIRHFRSSPAGGSDSSSRCSRSEPSNVSVTCSEASGNGTQAGGIRWSGRANRRLFAAAVQECSHLRRPMPAPPRLHHHTIGLELADDFWVERVVVTVA